MHRKPLLSLLKNYNTNHLDEKIYKERTIEFVENEPECFSRALLIGHITGSAFIVNEKLTKTVLVLHAKIHKWLQPGGHADGEPNIMAVALKEAGEETGLKKLKVVSEILDIDVHTIPARKEVPEHLHYDIRFLFLADEFEPFVISDESTDIQWIMLEDIPKFNEENSIMRMVNKVQNRTDLFV
jgi:8-oxo-dGTP pyrophosphatase MutT (NUDIX family)